MNAKEFVGQLLSAADVRVNGDRPWDIQIHDERFYDRVVADGTLGVGEAYMDGWWDSEQLDEMMHRVIRTGGERAIARTWTGAWLMLKSKALNLQTHARALRVAREHYDLGNELYEAFLDPYNQYTCGYFKDTDDLNRAQEQKLDLICRKLQLTRGDRVLDIGCGWGGFSKWAAEHYGCHVTGISISDEQIAYAKEFTRGCSVDIVKKDYRDIAGQYDKVLICGMIEHVGYKNYRTILGVVRRVLAPGGLFLLHTIGSSRSVTTNEPWSHKYIFPNSMAPSTTQISRAAEGLFIVEDWHNFGQYYDPTLLAWWKNFKEAWPRFGNRYGERFYRMFRYYLLGSAGAFRARDLQLWQIVLSPHGVQGGYVAVR